MRSILFGSSRDRVNRNRSAYRILVALALLQGLTWTAPKLVVPAGTWQVASAQEVPQTLRLLAATPTRVTATPVSATAINLSWTDIATNERGYRVSQRVPPSTVWTVLANLPANSTRYSNTGLKAATQYSYRVCAVTTGGGTNCAANVAARTFDATAAPTGVIAAAHSSSRIDLVWKDNATNEGGYRISRRLTSATDTPANWAVTANLRPDSTNYSDTGLAATTQYTYRVCAIAPGGTLVCAADIAATTLASTAAPTRLTVTASSPTQIDLTWTDAATNERGYHISRRLTSATDAPQNWITLAVLATNATSYSSTGLTAATGYTYRVCAIAPGVVLVCAADRATVTLATTAPTGVAAVPLSAAPFSASQISLSWTDAATNETGYRIWRWTSSTTWTALPAISANVTSYIDTGLTAATHYTYRVCAVAPGGEVCAAEVSATTSQSGFTNFYFTTASVSANGAITRFSGDPVQQYVQDLEEGVRLEMVVIPRGSFAMGSLTSEVGSSSEEREQRVVHVNKFAMGKYEVTQAQWRVVMGTNPSRFTGNNLPVEQVSWNDAQEFCRRLNARLGLSGSNAYRLPTEAEWEYAGRAGTTTPFAFGETIHADIVNYDGRFPYRNAPRGHNRGQTVDVGGLGVANRWGLYDMHGNVWEWCEDDWRISYFNAPVDGSAWMDSPRSPNRVIRGGSWADGALDSRSARRNGVNPGSKFFDGGFRLARTLP